MIRCKQSFHLYCGDDWICNLVDADRAQVAVLVLDAAGCALQRVAAPFFDDGTVRPSSSLARM